MRFWLLIPAFALLAALGAQASVPMAPVPMTLQSLAVALAGLALGWRGGAAAMGLYLALGAVGLPVFSGGGSGMDALTGPTAGYLWSFPLAAALTGLAAGRTGRRGVVLSFALALLAHGLTLGLGVAWLARELGWPQALAAGFTPFLIGAGVKSLAAALAHQPFRRLAGFPPATR